MVSEAKAADTNRSLIQRSKMKKWPKAYAEGFHAFWGSQIHGVSLPRTQEDLRFT